MLTANDITIRDPYVLVHEGKYYMYGTRSHLTWKQPEDLSIQGFDCYISEDLINFSEPVEVFGRPDNFWSDRNFWAPEVHEYQGAFYLFATFIGPGRRRGTQVLKADNPLGLFVEHSQGPLTPADWECLDGTLYVSKAGTPYMVFCHEWVQIKYGTVCAVELSPDLSTAVGEPFELINASHPSWADGDGGKDRYVTDGPCFYRTKTGELIMFWSSLKNGEYVEAIAISSNGEIDGQWTTHDELLYDADGGHGMAFTGLDGELYFTLHAPNVNYNEHPVFMKLKDLGDRVRAV
ncbi:MAG: glycoside hydrolase family 43 protein [Turicibacter sp.]|nr:glycoside hydrolase family 43 protein [Turicibacter sp.]